MKTITLQVADGISEKFFWLLARFSRDEIKILEQSDDVSDDEYLRGIEGMVETIQAARNEPIGRGLTIDELDWWRLRQV